MIKSCLSILFLLIFIPTVWWSYSRYRANKDCENCQKSLTKYYLHFEGWEHWNKTVNYYLLECFCDKKVVLKKINTMRKNIVNIINKDVTFLMDDFYESEGKGDKGLYYGSKDEVQWDKVFANLVAVSFIRDTTSLKRLSGLWFGVRTDTLQNKKVQRKELSKSWGRVVYNVDYEELNRSVLNQFAQTVYKDSTRFTYNTCVYHLYNRQAKKVEATMKYEDKGKGFYFEIW